MYNNSYVYIYYDPNTNKPFYVGKGVDDRYKVHLRESRWSNPKNRKNPFLYWKIKSLIENGTPPIVKKVCENMSNKDAFDMEGLLIDENITFAMAVNLDDSF